MSGIIIVSDGQQNENERLLDEGGSARWRREYDEMCEAGVYDRIAEAVADRRIQLMIDICSGFCPLEQRMAKAHPETHFVGVDINTTTLALAQRDITQEGISSHIYRARNGDNIIADRNITTQGDLYERSWESMRGEVLLIEDDITRAARTILEATNGEMADLSVSTFAGVSRKAAAREGAPQSVEEYTQRITAPFELAAEVTRTRGKLLVVQRSVQEKELTDRTRLERVGELFTKTFGKLWKITRKPEFLDVDIDGIRSAGTPHLSDRLLKQAYILEAERTAARAGERHFTTSRADVAEFISRPENRFA